MSAGFVACCPLVSHSEYADGTDVPHGQVDGRQTVTLTACVVSYRLTLQHITMENFRISGELANLNYR